MSLLIVWLCGVEGMFVFFLKMQNTQCGYHLQFVKPHGPPDPKEKAETGRLTQERRTAEADSSTNRKAAKEMATSKPDVEQQSTHLGPNQGTNAHDNDGNW
jgi:hypothetical protein